MAYEVFIFSQNELRETTDSTEQTLFARTIRDNCTGYFTLKVVARKTSNGASKIFTINGGFKNNTGNATVFTDTLPLLGTTGDLLELLLVTATVDTSSDDVRVRVKGLGSTSIQWYGSMDGQEEYQV